MLTCERHHLNDGLRQCDKPATWQFNYKYLYQPCTCKDPQCPVIKDASEGSTALCHGCYEQSVKDGADKWDDNQVEPGKRFTQIEE